MLPEAPRRLAEIFHLARELPVVDRAIYLDRECAGEPELRRQVEELLAHDQPEDDLLERPAWDGISAAAHSSEGPPRPPFNLKELLGKGDIGQVFRLQPCSWNPCPDAFWTRNIESNGYSVRARWVQSFRPPIWGLREPSPLR